MSNVMPHVSSPRHQLGPGGLASHPEHGDGDAGGGPPRGRVEDVRGHGVGVRPHGARHRAAHRGPHLRQLLRVAAALNLNIQYNYFRINTFLQ